MGLSRFARVFFREFHSLYYIDVSAARDRLGWKIEGLQNLHRSHHFLIVRTCIYLFISEIGLGFT